MSYPQRPTVSPADLFTFKWETEFYKEEVTWTQLSYKLSAGQYVDLGVSVFIELFSSHLADVKFPRLFRWR